MSDHENWSRREANHPTANGLCLIQGFGIGSPKSAKIQYFFIIEYLGHELSGGLQILGTR